MAVDELELSRVDGARLRLEVRDLPADHAPGAGGLREKRHRAEPPLERHGAGRGGRGEDLERVGLERVAREDRHGFAEHDVGRGLTAPQGVVVHRGQVVVDE